VKLTHVGEVIATRRLRFDDDPKREARVLIGKPIQFSDSTDYYCPYQIVGVGTQKVGRAGGFDGVQAIEEAIRILPVELTALLKENPTLRWEDAPLGNFGFREPSI